jgi:peptide/nickel transport system permease protein
VSKKFQFYFGLIVLLLIGCMILFPNLFTSANPYATEGMRSYVDDEGVFNLEKAPFKPQWSIPLGTDELGRHVWALIVYGTKLTMLLAFFIVIARFLLAIPFGFLAGFGSLSAHGIIDKLSRFFGTIPTLLLCIILLKMDYFIGLEKQYSILAFVLLLGFVGFGKLGIVIEERVASINREPFVTGDVAIGKNKFQIAATTVFKHLYPELIVMFFLEFARALTLLLQLGLFAVFVGNVRFIEDTMGGMIKTIDISYEPEWASMLGAARNNIRVAPWIVFFPALAFFISVLGLNAFGEGLRWVLSGELKFNKMGKKLSVGIAGLLLTLIIFQGYGYYERNLSFSIDAIDFSSIDLEDSPTVIGNENASKVAQFLASSLKQRGFKPLSGDAYVHGYSVEPGFYTTSQSLIVSLPNDASNQTELTESVRWIAHGNFDVNSDVIDLCYADLYATQAIILDQPAILLLDAQFYNEQAVIQISERLSKIENVQGIIWKQNLDMIRDQRMSQLSLAVPVLYVDKKSFNGSIPSKTDQLNDCEHIPTYLKVEEVKLDIKMHIKQTYAQTGTDGKNVYAILPGTSESMGEEAIIYGFSYNSETRQSLEDLISLQMAIIDDITQSAPNRKRTIIVAFFDGTLSDTFNGMRDYASKSLYSQKDVLLYVDLTRIQGLKEGKVVFDQEQSPITRYYAYTFSLQLKEKFDKKNIVYDAIANPTELDRLLFFEKSFPTMIVGFKENLGEPEDSVSIKQLGSILTSLIKNNSY